MKLLIFRDGMELKKVKCPREYVPPVPLEACKECRWHVSIQIPQAEDEPPYVVCHLDNDWHNAPLLP